MDTDRDYNPNDTVPPEVRAYGELRESSKREFAREDREAAESDATGRISQRTSPSPVSFQSRIPVVSSGCIVTVYNTFFFYR